MPQSTITADPSRASDDTTGARLARDFASTWSTSRWFWLAAIAIVLLTIFLRLWRLDLVIFMDDQATLLRLAEDIARLGSLPLAGMTSSIGIPLAPTFEYLLAPIVAVSRDPRVATAAIGLANAAGVAGTLALGWRWFSPADRRCRRAGVCNQSLGRLLRAEGVEQRRASADRGVVDVLPG